METKLSKMTKEKIFETETALRDKITELCGEYDAKFSALGYSVNCEFERCTENTEYKSDKMEAPADYSFGYNCRVCVIIKRPKTAEEKAADEKTASEISAAAEEIGEGETCSMDEIRNDAAFDADNKAVAVTQLMLTRIYKSFWIDKIILCDDISPLSDDLSEFLAKLAAEKEKGDKID